MISTHGCLDTINRCNWNSGRIFMEMSSRGVGRVKRPTTSIYPAASQPAHAREIQSGVANMLESDNR